MLKDNHCVHEECLISFHRLIAAFTNSDEFKQLTNADRYAFQIIFTAQFKGSCLQQIKPLIAKQPINKSMLDVATQALKRHYKDGIEISKKRVRQHINTIQNSAVINECRRSDLKMKLKKLEQVKQRRLQMQRRIDKLLDEQDRTSQRYRLLLKQLAEAELEFQRVRHWKLFTYTLELKECFYNSYQKQWKSNFNRKVFVVQRLFLIMNCH